MSSSFGRLKFGFWLTVILGLNYLLWEQYLVIQAQLMHFDVLDPEDKRKFFQILTVSGVAFVASLGWISFLRAQDASVSVRVSLLLVLSLAIVYGLFCWGMTGHKIPVSKVKFYAGVISVVVFWLALLIKKRLWVAPDVGASATASPTNSAMGAGSRLPPSSAITRAPAPHTAFGQRRTVS